MLIAIDGPAASGKGTIAKKIAKHYGLEYLDTGRLYRAVGYTFLKQEGSDMAELSNEQIKEKATNIAAKLDLKTLGLEEIETEEVGKYASIVSAIPEVRDILKDIQIDVAKSPVGAVLDGRDIGTVICPDADFKFFITANPQIRAKRRFLQLQSKKKDVSETAVLEDIRARDERDSGRKVAPLAPASDAIFIDTSELSIDDVFNKAKGIIDSSV